MTRFLLTLTTALALLPLAAQAHAAGTVRPVAPTIFMAPIPNPVIRVETAPKPAVAPRVTAPTGSITDIVTALGQMTKTDLDTAISIANVPQQPDVEGIQCFNWLEQQLPINSTQPQFIPPTGIVSTVETGHVGLSQLNKGVLSPTQKVAFEMACGPWIMSVQGDLAALAAAGIALGVHVPVPPPLPFLAPKKN